MKKMKTILTMVTMMMVLGMAPVNASAASKLKVTATPKMDTHYDSPNWDRWMVIKGEPVQLTVKYNGKNVTSKAVYKSSNKKIVSVSQKGKLTAKKAGKCTVTITYKGKTKKMKLLAHKHEWRLDYVAEWYDAGTRDWRCDTCGVLLGALKDGETVSESTIRAHQRMHEEAGESAEGHYEIALTSKSVPEYYCSCGRTKKVK